jgi:small subunit ribosomal protein S20
MANIASSKKDARRSAVRAVRNRSVRSAVKTKITRLRRVLAERGEGTEEAGPLAVTAVAALDRAAAKGVLHPNNAARRKSRLMKRLNAAESGTSAQATETSKATAGRSSRARSTSGKSPAKASTRRKSS